MHQTTRALKACGNHHRLRLLRVVLGVRKPVQQGDLVDLLGIPQHLAARYLQILVEAGLLARERRGLPVRYRTPKGASPLIRRIHRMVRAMPMDIFDIPESGLEGLRKKVQ